MMHAFLHFIRYNNGFPILLGMIFLSAGGVFAASPEMRGNILASEQVVRSVDNTRIAHVNLDAYDVTIQIVDVKEDAETYYIFYTMESIELVDGVWQDVLLPHTLTVPKDLLDGRDLGRYASKELADIRAHELARLRETQRFERAAGISQKVVTTVYSGLIGRMLDPTEEKFPGYQPVVPEVVADTRIATPEENAEALRREEERRQALQGVARADTHTSQQGSGGAPSSSPQGSVSVSILGNNPARVPIGSTYVDLGAVVHGPNGENLSYVVLINGRPYDYILLDTSEENSYAITYRATSAIAGTAEATRTVIVYNPSSGTSSTPSPSGTTTPTTSTTTPGATTPPPPTSETPLSEEHVNPSPDPEDVSPPSPAESHTSSSTEPVVAPE